MRIRDALGKDAVPRPYFYAGPPGATLQVLASRDGTLILSMRLFDLFSATDRSCWHLELAQARARPKDITLRPGLVTTGVPVSSGVSTITLLATPTKAMVSSALPEVSRLGGLADTKTDLLPEGAASGSGSDGWRPNYEACDARPDSRH